MMQAAASQLAAVGVQLSLKPETTTGAWVNDLVSRRYPCTSQAASGKPASMEIPYLFLPGGIMNPFNFSDAKVSSAYEALLNASPDQTPALARAAMKATIDEALNVPIVLVDDIFIYNNTKRTGVQFETNAPLLTTVETWQPR